MPVPAVLAGIATGGGLANLLLGIYPPLSTAYSKWSYSKWPNMIPGLGDLIELRYRQGISESEYTTTAGQIGFNESWAGRLYDSGAMLLSAMDYIRLWRRGKLEESALDVQLGKLRLSAATITHLKTVSEYFPSPADLIHLAVREVYTPATVEKFGQLEDLPEKFLTEAAKAGLTKEQAEYAWSGHWLLPSPGQGFEMFQRDVIDESTLSMLLKALDIMPFWRDKLTQIAYATLTRVDVRRMHAMGVLDDTQTFDAYRHQGQSPANAELMLQFTKEYNAEGSKGMTRANVISGYKLGLFDESQLQEYLQAFGYSEEVVTFWVDMASYEKTVSLISASKAELEAQYQRGMISQAEYRQRLDAMDLPAAFVDNAVVETVSQASKKVRMPTRTDLENWLKAQIIDDVYYATQMKNLGYRQDDIEYFLTEITLEVDTSQRKFLPITTYARWLRTGILAESDFRRVAGTMAIAGPDIDRLVREVEAKQSESD